MASHSLDFLSNFIDKARVELAVLSLSIFVGASLKRGLELPSWLLMPTEPLESEFFRNVFPGLSWSSISQKTHLIIGLVGLTLVLVVFGTSRGQFYDSHIRGVIYTFSFFILVPPGVWARLVLFSVFTSTAAIIFVFEKTVRLMYSSSKAVSKIYILAFQKLSILMQRLGSERANLVITFLLITLPLLAFMAQLSDFPIALQPVLFDVLSTTSLAAFLLFLLATMDVIFRQNGLDLNEAMDPGFQIFRRRLLAPIILPAEFVGRLVETQNRRKEVNQLARIRAAELRAYEDARPKLELVSEPIVVPQRRPKKAKPLPNFETRDGISNSQKAFRATKKHDSVLPLQLDLMAPVWDGDITTLVKHLHQFYPGQSKPWALHQTFLARAKSIHDVQ